MVERRREDIHLPILTIDGAPVAARRCVFMKVGSHGDEGFSAIVERKCKEEVEAGYMLWGYAGTLLDAAAARGFLSRRTGGGAPPLLLMIETKSPFANTPARSRFFSLDRHIWHRLPERVGTRGCDKAIVCRKLTRTEITVDLDRYRVAAGPSAGRVLSGYLRGRTDKACAEYHEGPPAHPCPVTIRWAAEILPPFAVYLAEDDTMQLRMTAVDGVEDLGVLVDGRKAPTGCRPKHRRMG